MQTRVQLVTTDARQVVALGVEKQTVKQVACRFQRGRLARPLLAEELDEGAVLGLRHVGVGLEREADVERVVEQAQDVFVRARPAGEVLAQVAAHRPQEDGDRKLALAVDTGVDPALLVDLDLEPGTALRHQVRDEDLLLAVLGLHHVGARRAHELRDDDTLGAVDDEGAPVGHPREITHEHRLLADLTGLAVLEGDLHVERTRIGEVALATLGDRGVGRPEVELFEDDREVARVVLDRRDLVDHLAQTTVGGIDEPLERAALDVD
ncbi:hypothetical protein HRbin41_01294 [bacterium HR41]|nr:hypothetical protein HRbin41_01294 [bacterium HR41]